MENTKNNGILVRISLIRPFARESTKKLIILELFFTPGSNYQKIKLKRKGEKIK